MLSRDYLVDGLYQLSYAPNGTAFHLAQVEWCIFGTLTWRQDWKTTRTPGAQQARRRDFLSLIGVGCKLVGIRPRRLAIYRKTEFGAGQRAHFNFLIARDGLESINPHELARTLQETWRHGRAEIEPFDSGRHLAGVVYQSKLEFDGSGNELLPQEELSRPLRALVRNNANLADVMAAP